MDGLKSSTISQLRRSLATYVHKVPMMGESVTEGTISSWQKKVGDQVNEDEVFVTIETDKVSLKFGQVALQRYWLTIVML